MSPIWSSLGVKQIDNKHRLGRFNTFPILIKNLFSDPSTGGKEREELWCCVNHFIMHFSHPENTGNTAFRMRTLFMREKKV